MAQMNSNEKRRSHIHTASAAAVYDWKLVIKGLRKIHRRTLDEIELCDGERLLDIGCGTGLILRELKRRYPGAELMGVDASEGMLEVAKRNSPEGIEYKLAYADDLPAPPEYFDFVICVLTAHHLPPEEKSKMINEAFRVLKRGGKFLVVDLGRPKGFWGRFLWILSRSHSFTKGNMECVEEEMTKVGFETVKARVYMGYIEHLLAVKP